MPRLETIQAAIRAGILGNPADEAAAAIVAAGIPAERRLAIYRNNTLASLTRALADTFPAVERLVDPRFFAYAADAYVRAEPPRHAWLSAYGGGFPDFLTRFDATRDLPWLADVARLEWTLSDAWHAADAPTLTPDALASFDPVDYPRLRLAPHPTARLLRSQWPIDRLWRANRGHADAVETQVALGPVPTRLLIHRPRGDVHVRALTEGEFIWLTALAAEATLEGASAAALLDDHGFDVGAALGMALATGCFAAARI